jgi:hypothetical protein
VSRNRGWSKALQLMARVETKAPHLEGVRLARGGLSVCKHCGVHPVQTRPDQAAQRLYRSA